MKKMKTKTNPYFTKSVDGKRSFSRDRRKKGVSPVIGVILMVAATIVIAAVVLAMLGGFTAPTRQYVVTATATSNATGTGIAVTYQGGPDANLVTNVRAVGENPVGTESIVDFGNTVGNSTVFAGTAGAGNDHIVVNASFSDNSNQVILDTWI
jgi:flagellin-like protein